MDTDVAQYLDVISTLFVAISAFLVFWQIKISHKWNRKKTGEEALTQMLNGVVLANVDAIKKEVGWSILKDETNYETIISKLAGEDKELLDRRLTQIFRHLETITIKIEHDIIDEAICFDYMFDIVIKTTDRCYAFLEMEKEERKQPRLYEHVKRYADAWKKDIAEGREH